MLTGSQLATSGSLQNDSPLNQSFELFFLKFTVRNELNTGRLTTK